MLTFSLFKLLPAIFVVCFFVSKSGMFLGFTVNTVSFLICAFVALDILDGRVAKILKRDTAGRRLLDNITDIFVSHGICISLFGYVGWSLWWYFPLFVRDVFISGIASISVLNHKAVVFPNWVHKMAKLTLVLAVLCILNGWWGEMILILSYMAVFFTAADYYGLFRTFVSSKRAQISGPIVEFHPAPFQGICQLSHGKEITNGQFNQD